MNSFLSCSRTLLRGLALVLTLTPAGIAAEGIENYDEHARAAFWRKLYPGGGWSLYCGYRFNRSRKTASNHVIEIEHIYPTGRMAEHAGCHNRMQCRESDNTRFTRMEADLHNMYPVWQAVITYRYDRRFELVGGEVWRFDDCDLEWKTGVIEPRKIARGNVARAMLYMHSRYTIPVDRNDLALFRLWNRIDPPSRQEQARNDLIERIQGNRNPYIDRPSMAEDGQLSVMN